MSESFPYERDRRFAAIWLPLLIGPGVQGVTLTDGGQLIARYGLLQLETALSNVADAHVTGPYRWWTAVGPRLSLADDGLTFGTNNIGGVCVHFRAKVPSALRHRGHSALTVTVANVAGLVAALEEAQRRLT